MDASLTDLTEREVQLGEILAALIEAIEAGEPIDRAVWLTRHAEFAVELREFFASQDRLHSLAAPLRQALVADTPAPATTLHEGVLPVGVGQRFGDCEVLEEIGRGGMGIVFKARQMGANRIVALKVLRTDPLGGREQAQRFRNEAEMVAQLDHPHIVPLYEVGQDAGRVYFSMKLIDGGSLADQLEQFTPQPRRAAEVVAAVARAVHHAHQRGVLHRDLKPANILLDRDGRPFVADFGLARRTQPDANLTQSGAIVGTPGYMAPEQASGVRGEVTTATDVYGLGAILYALLAGRPPFQADSVLDVLMQVREREPEPLRKLNPLVDRDLETICLKCLRKSPAERYVSALAVADDLERWLRGEPISARRVTLGQRLGRWARRHPRVVAAAALIVVLALAGVWVWDRQRAQAEGAARQVAAEAETLHRQDRLQEALAVAQRACDLLPRFGGDAALRRQVNELAADLALLARLDEIREEERSLVGPDGRGFDQPRAGARYQQAFLDHGIDVLNGEEPVVVEALGRDVFRGRLTPLLEEWSIRAGDPRERERLIRLAEAVDEDPSGLMRRARQALRAKDVEALKRLVAEAETNPPSAAAVLVLVRNLTAAGPLWPTGVGSRLLHNQGLPGDKAAPPPLSATERLLLAAQRRFPGDFWLNHALGLTLMSSPHQSRNTEAVSYIRAALAIRPLSVNVWLNLGTALGRSNRPADAVAAFRRALELKPDDAGAHGGLGLALEQMGKDEESLRAFRRAVTLEPRRSEIHANLGNVLHKLGRHADAVEAYRRAIELEPNLFRAHYSLGLALLPLGRVKDALEAFQQAARLEPGLADAHYKVGCLLDQVGKPGDAVVAYRRTIEIDPDYAEAHCNCGSILRQQGKFAESLAAYQRGHDIGSKRPNWKYPSDRWVKDARQLVRLDDRLSAVLSGEAQPDNPAEQLALARFCTRRKKHHAAAARLYAGAFTAEPKAAGDLRQGHRYHAARAAALAGCGQGEDAAALGPMQRLRWRRQALTWLSGDLRAWQQFLAQEPVQTQPVILRAMQHWQTNAVFNGVRGEVALGRLPGEERVAWAKLWVGVANLLAQVKEPQPRDKEKPTRP
jgi:serine/threonine-protein kinase